MLLQILKLSVWLVLVPLGIGCIPAHVLGGKYRNAVFAFCSGYMCMWAVFQVIAVPCIIREVKMDVVVRVFTVTGMGLALSGFGLTLAYLFRNKGTRQDKELMDTSQILWWGLFGALLLFQLYKTLTCAYADGDDAFYIAAASSAQESGDMYRKLPYTGGAEEVDAGYGLAPFPIWIAFLGRISQSNTAFTAHSVVAVCMVLLSYMIYILIGRELFDRQKEKVPVFMVFTSLLILFGNYSIYTGETFLLTRSRQGKAALAGAVIPFLLFLLLMTGKQLQEKKRPGIWRYLLLAATVTAACLCSTMGTFLAGLLVAAGALFLSVCYQKWKVLLAMGVSCLPALVFVGLYVALQ